MLQALGLDSLSGQVYCAMLAHPNESVPQLTARLGLTADQIGGALSRLSELSLVYRSVQESGRPRALGPEAAMEVLLAREEAALAAQRQRMESVRAAAAQLVAECTSIDPWRTGEGAERITGIEAIHQRLNQLGDKAQNCVMTFAPGGGHREEDIQASSEPNETLLSRGVEIRTIYLDSVRNHQLTLRHVEWLSSRGAQVRTVASLPVRMIIIDRELAVLPADLGDARAAAVVVRGRSLLVALCALFDQFWAIGAPLGLLPSPRGEAGLTTQQREVLRLLAQGHTDESVAKRLGISPRSARRITSDLLQRLKARSRFEAGVRAVQKGWIPVSGV